MGKNDLIPIGALARRTGIAVSAIRFYESKGLLTSLRTGGNQRRFLRSDIRRLSFVLIAQQLGLGLAEIERALASLPQGRTPTRADWQTISHALRDQLDAKIRMLNRTKQRLEGCIGCGCLSLEICQLYNKDDHVSENGAGPRLVIDD